MHERSGAPGTLALVPVEDPSAYGLVRIDDDGRVLGFLEKPSPDEIDTDLISAGAYVLERSVLDLIAPDRNVSIEREVWPCWPGAGCAASPIARPTGSTSGRRSATGRAPPTSSPGACGPRPGRARRAARRGRRALRHRRRGARPSTARRRRADRRGRDRRPGDRARARGRDRRRSASSSARSLLDGARVGEGARVHDSILGPGASVGAGAQSRGRRPRRGRGGRGGRGAGAGRSPFRRCRRRPLSA